MLAFDLLRLLLGSPHEQKSRQRFNVSLRVIFAGLQGRTISGW